MVEHRSTAWWLTLVRQMVIWTDIRRRSMFLNWQLEFELNSEHRYVAKIIYTYILGYKVDVGHMEAINLISSNKYSEKQMVC